MYSSRRLLTLALACTALIASAADAVYQRAVRPVVEAAVCVGLWLKRQMLDAFKLAGGEDEGEAQPAVMLVQAKAFVLRLAKRERPEVTGSWRMCPST
ncbi:hypothetical protein [Polaromonas sp.]|uniref:hypothetical protein n=1 Tax=Polaromonas sp. TaxID=1869339 RepID=UPI0032665F9D